MMTSAPGCTAGRWGRSISSPPRIQASTDQEFFLVLKEFSPSLTRNAEMDEDFLVPSARDPSLETPGESARKAAVAAGMPYGYEVEYRDLTINGHTLGFGEPIRVKRNQRVLLHIVNGSATAIRSLALPGHTFHVLALDGNPVPTPADLPVLWLGPGERISALVTMNHPGVWILGDIGEDRFLGMGTIVEYRRSDRRRPVDITTVRGVGLPSVRHCRWRPNPAGRNHRSPLHRGQCRRQGLQPMAHQRRGVRNGDDGATGAAPPWTTLSPSNAQRER